MKKYVLYPQWLPIFLALSLWAMGFFYFKSFAYAEDSVASFEQEVIYAKQKHQAIVSQINGPRRIIVNPQGSNAQDFLNEIKKNSISTETINPAETPAPSVKKWPWLSNLKSVLIHDKPMKEIKLEPFKNVVQTFKKSEEEENNGWFLRNLTYKEKKPTDGEFFYKVAVSDNRITLKEAVEIAKANSINLKALKKKIEVAKAKLVEAKRAMYPTVQGVMTGNGGLAAQISGSDPHGRVYKGESRKINVSQPIFYGGELVLTVKQAETNLKSSECELKKGIGELTHQVKIAYYGVVKAEYNLQYQTDLFKEVNEIHERILKGYKEKAVAEIDYLNTESEFQQVYFLVEGANNDLSSAMLILLQTLDLAPDRNFPLDLHLNFVKVNPNMEDVTERALQNNPDVKIKEYAFLSAKYGVQVYQAKKYPHVDLRGSYGYLGENFTNDTPGDIGNHDIDPEKEWFVGLQTSMPLGPNSVEYSQIKHQYGPTVLSLHGSQDWEHKVTFNLFDKLSDITDEKSAQAALLQAQSDLEKAKNDVILKIKDDFYNLQKSLIQIDSSAAKMRFQDKQDKILRYTVGLQEERLQNLLEGLIELAQDRFSFIQAVSDYHLAVSSLNQSIGDPDALDSEPKPVN
ncbi:MAG: hypothetical protein AUJ72_01065 [Candidatus Omnitrophica bacterium CG1_02_46_14]|nr:MAG: hypothetical protein AUJ72_01065 [Candidatus Omnitrophica bacterium CG1_02_46_14]